jgi:hypothetical protein
MKTSRFIGGAGDYIFRFGLDVLAAFWGSELAEDKKGREAVGRELRKALPPPPDREDVFKELIRLGPEGQAIRNLLEEANTRHGGIITIRLPDGREVHRTENWVMSRLLEFEPRDRRSMFAILNQILEEDGGEAAFLASLELINNDRFAQWLRLLQTRAGNRATQFNDSLEPLARWLEDLAGLEHPTEEGGEA